MEIRPLVVASLIGTCLAGCAARAATPELKGYSRSSADAREGVASYYGKDFHGKTTASGAPFDMNAMVAAHPSYPFGTLVRVTNLQNGRSVLVSILDRGPASAPRTRGVIIDLSRRAAQVLGFLRQGRTHVRLEVQRWGVPRS